MTIEKVVNIFNKWGGINNKVWHSVGDETNFDLFDAEDKKLNLKNWMYKAIARWWKQINAKSAVPTVEGTSIVLTQDTEDDSVQLFIVLDKDLNVISHCKKTAEGTFDVANLPEGDYTIIAVSNTGEAIRTELITIVKPVEPIEE